MLAPTLFSDANGNYVGGSSETVRRSHSDVYSTFSLWDTYRSQSVLIGLLRPQAETDAMMRSLLLFSDDSDVGTLPKWPLFNRETDTMIGYPAAIALAEHVLKHRTVLDMTNILGNLVRTATVSAGRGADGEAVRYARQNRFIPYDVGVRESVSRGLEMAFADACISRVAAMLGRELKRSEGSVEAQRAAISVARTYAKRSMLYREYFDSETGFMRPRLENGTFASPFDPRVPSYDTIEGSFFDSGFTESTAFQYTFSVPHDIPGLIQLMGGERSFMRKLDLYFSDASRPITPAGVELPKDVGASLFGGHTVGNEVAMHIPYLYNFVSRPDRTQETVHRILTRYFNATPSGLPGNDDFGTLSAFFIFGSLGFYPVDPCSDRYEIGRPLVRNVTLRVMGASRSGVCRDGSQDVRTLRIVVRNQSMSNMYVQDAWFDNVRLNRTFVRHSEIVCGGVLTFIMGPLASYTALRPRAGTFESRRKANAGPE
eukprot:g2660.t1